MKKGDWFKIDVDAFARHKVEYFKDKMPSVAQGALVDAERLRGKEFQVHRIERREILIFRDGSGFSGVHKRFCTKVSKPQVRRITDLERGKGRSEGYWQMSAEDQWNEDKALGILDWDGN